MQNLSSQFFDLKVMVSSDASLYLGQVGKFVLIYVDKSQLVH